MVTAPRGLASNAVIGPLATHVAELELEVDRLRRQAAYIEQTVSDAMQRIRRICADQGELLADSTFGVVASVSEEIAHIVRDLHEPVASHPAHDGVTAIAIRPLAEQVFRWQQRLSGMPQARLHLDLKAGEIDWFPVRLRNILDGLFSNALDHVKGTNGEIRVSLEVRRVAQGFEIRVSDNGPQNDQELDSEYEHRLVRAADEPRTRNRSELEAVALIVKQSGGGLTIETCQGVGICRVAKLPVFDAGDFLDPN